MFSDELAAFEGGWKTKEPSEAMDPIKRQSETPFRISSLILVECRQSVRKLAFVIDKSMKTFLIFSHTFRMKYLILKQKRVFQIWDQ